MAMKKIKISPSDPGEQYLKVRQKYVLLTQGLRPLLKSLIAQRGLEILQIEKRTKTAESFSNKIIREGKSYKKPLEEMTDLSGLRIICFYTADAQQVAKIIEKEFLIDVENSMDKLEKLPSDRFGYTSIHYVASLRPPRSKTTEWREFDGMKFEIQIRTVLQHAWAAIDHKLRYKSAQDIPKDLQRKLFRLEAILELADEEFMAVREQTEKIDRAYGQSIDEGNLKLDLNLSSLEAYFRKKSIDLERLRRIAIELGYRGIDIPPESPIASRGMHRLLVTAQIVGVKTIAEMRGHIRNPSEEQRKFLDRLRRNCDRRGWNPTANPYNAASFLLFHAFRKSVDLKSINSLKLRREIRESLKETITAKKKVKKKRR